MMTQYGSYSSDGAIIRARDGACIPSNPQNRDYQEAMAAVAAGDTIAAYAPPSPTIDDYRLAVQARIDSVARSHQYDDGVACASYKDSTNATWAAEAAAFIAWRDAVWVYALGELEKVQSGQRTQPAVADFVAELPAIQWPQ
jgi:hypothetical protein